MYNIYYIQYLLLLLSYYYLLLFRRQKWSKKKNNFQHTQLSLTDSPSLEVPNDKVPKETRKTWFSQLCLDYVEIFFGGRKILELVDQVQKLQQSSLNKFKCRVEGCNAEYVHHSRRVRWICKIVFLIFWYDVTLQLLLHEM